MSTDSVLLDTTVLIASERGEIVNALNDVSIPAISIVTLAELKAGVVAAQGTSALLRRLRTLEAAHELRTYVVDERVADAWVALRSHLHETGRRVAANDLWIAATAVARSATLFTHDSGFEALEGAPGFRARFF